MNISVEPEQSLSVNISRLAQFANDAFVILDRVDTLSITELENDTESYRQDSKDIEYRLDDLKIMSKNAVAEVIELRAELERLKYLTEAKKQYFTTLGKQINEVLNASKVIVKATSTITKIEPEYDSWREIGVVSHTCNLSELLKEKDENEEKPQYRRGTNDKMNVKSFAYPPYRGENMFEIITKYARQNNLPRFNAKSIALGAFVHTTDIQLQIIKQSVGHALACGNDRYWKRITTGVYKLMD
jgi:hypothetical protein